MNNRPLMAFKLHNPTGMANHLMSLEIGLGLQYALGYKKAVFYHCGSSNPHPWDQSHISKFIDRACPVPRIIDLVDLPDFAADNLYLDIPVVHPEHFDRELLERFTFHFGETKVKQVTAFNCVSVGPRTEGDDQFLGLRSVFDCDRTKDVNFVGANLAFYSRFFMNRTKEFDLMLSQIRWKAEYVELAARVAESIGPFNGAHARLTDHTHNYSLLPEAYSEGINKLKDVDKLPLVICTDDPNNAMFKGRTPDALLVNDIINNSFGADFAALPFTDSVAYGLVSMLVMFHAQDFVGTPGSTYTGLIHRAINQRGQCNFNFWREDNLRKFDKGLHSWSDWSLSGRDPSIESWWREWPESRLQIDV